MFQPVKEDEARRDFVFPSDRLCSVTGERYLNLAENSFNIKEGKTNYERFSPSQPIVISSTVAVCIFWLLFAVFHFGPDGRQSVCSVLSDLNSNRALWNVNEMFSCE